MDSYIKSALKTMQLGDTVLQYSTDYKIAVSGGTNYGDTGTIKITGTSGSKYLQEGTYVKWSYKIAQRLDLKNVVSGYASSKSFKYQGTAVTPTSFDNLTASGLVKGTDYTITSYSSNTAPGIAYVTITGKGNYTGTVTLKYKIYGDISSANITCSVKTYNRKKQNPSVTVTYYGKTLKKGTDYTVSGSGKNCGAYTITITGKGNYSGSKKKIMYIKPKKVTGLTKKSASKKSITLKWDSQKGAYYKIYVYDSGKKKWTQVATTDKTTYVSKAVYKNGKAVSLSSKTTYKYKVVAFISVKVNGKTVVKSGDASKVVSIKTK